MLDLAARLSHVPHDELVAGLQQREFDHAGISDFFDLADALLTEQSIAAAFAALPRPTLAVLATAVGLSTDGSTTLGQLDQALDGTITRVRERLNSLDVLRLLIVDNESITIPIEVALQVQGDATARISTTELREAAPSAATSRETPDREDESADAYAAEIAFRTIATLAEIVTAIQREPARELARGGLSAPDMKRLAEAANVEVETIPELVALAASASLISRESNRWVESHLSDEWLGADSLSRWRAIAEAWWNARPGSIRSLLDELGPLGSDAAFRAAAAWLYPLDQDSTLETVNAWLTDAERLGLSAHGTLSSAGRRLLDGDVTAAAASLSSRLPQHITRVYLQHDLSVVAPGPLAPELDGRLRAMTEVEGRELAATYRVSSTSIGRALTHGETEQSIREFLLEISLTGIPQPLDYLITETAQKYGRVRVGELDPLSFPQRSYVRSDDAALLATIEADQSLSALALHRSSPTRLTSKHPSEVVLWSVSDAKYPVAAENTDREIVAVRRHVPPRAHVTPEPAPDPIEALITRLHESDIDAATEATWMARRLNAAAKAKRTVLVAVRVSASEVREIELEPASVSNGRMRARDARADLERTIPLSAIESVTELSPS